MNETALKDMPTGWWVRELSETPELEDAATACGVWDRLTRRQWFRLRSKQPRLEKYRQVFFKTAAELYERALDDGACPEGLVWLKEQVDKGTPFSIVAQTMPMQYRIWCLSEHYEQMFNDWNPEQMTDAEWDWLLKYRPSFEHYRHNRKVVQDA